MFRFSIREILLFTLAVALGLGWWLHYRVVDANRQAVIRHAERIKAVLAAAKAQCEELELDATFYDKAVRDRVPYTMYFSHATHNVDWTVLDQPIPSGISN